MSLNGHREDDEAAVVLLSGGLDSATAAAKAIARHKRVIGLTLNYGQKNAQELRCAREVAVALGITEHFLTEVGLSDWEGLFSRQTLILRLKRRTMYRDETTFTSL